MKTQTLLVIALVIGAVTARAQSSYTTIQYNKNMQPALVIELPNSTDDVEANLLEKLKQAGYNPETKGSLFWKKNKIDGFYVFNDVMLPSLGPRRLDMYFKVVQKNKQEKDNSILYLLVSTGNGYFPSPTEDSVIWDRSQAFLNGLLQSSASYTLEKEIATQETAVTDARKKLARLQSDEKELTDKIRKYQADLMSNQGDQVGQQADIDNQSKLLENLKLKRKAMSRL